MEPLCRVKWYLEAVESLAVVPDDLRCRDCAELTRLGQPSAKPVVDRGMDALAEVSIFTEVRLTRKVGGQVTDGETVLEGVGTLDNVAESIVDDLLHGVEATKGGENGEFARSS